MAAGLNPIAVGPRRLTPAPRSQTYTDARHHTANNTGREHRGWLPAAVAPLARHTEHINALPKTQQTFVMQMIDTVLAQQGR